MFVSPTRPVYLSVISWLVCIFFHSFLSPTPSVSVFMHNLFVDYHPDYTYRLWQYHNQVLSTVDLIKGRHGHREMQHRSWVTLNHLKVAYELFDSNLWRFLISPMKTMQVFHTYLYLTTEMHIWSPLFQDCWKLPRDMWYDQLHGFASNASSLPSCTKLCLSLCRLTSFLTLQGVFSSPFLHISFSDKPRTKIRSLCFLGCQCRETA